MAVDPPPSPPSARRVLLDATGRPLQRHICPKCHKSFHWLCYLKRHMLTHDEKFAKDCGGAPGAAAAMGAKRVASGGARGRQGDLRSSAAAQLPPVHHSSRSKHVVAGSEIRPYVCDKCEADFASKLKLMRHINSVHGYPAEDSFSRYVFESRPSVTAAAAAAGLGLGLGHSLSRPQSCRLKDGRRRSAGAGTSLRHNSDDITRRETESSSSEESTPHPLLSGLKSLLKNVRTSCGSECERTPRSAECSDASCMAGRPATSWRPSRYVCPDCHQSFPWLSSLKRHIRASVENKQVYCNECNYGAKSKRDLRKHRRIHTRDLSHKYNGWEKPASQRTKFRIHSRIFNDSSSNRVENNYDAMQSQAWRLLTNSRHRSFRCEGCGASYSSRRHLIRHINCAHGYPLQRNYSSASNESSVN